MQVALCYNQGFPQFACWTSALGALLFPPSALKRPRELSADSVRFWLVHALKLLPVTLQGTQFLFSSLGNFTGQLSEI